MLITNNSDQMLQVALIDFQVNSNETASFKVTNLPAGTSTLVLESNKREFSDNDTYTYGNAATGYMDQPTLEEDKVELKTENGKITLKNKTDKELKTVYVYYKYMQIGGAYFGGITYRTPFENVGAGKEAEAVAAVEVEAAPPQAARLSAMAPARNADTRRFIYGSSLSGKQPCFIALPC